MIETGYYLELLTQGTIKLLEITNIKTTKNETDVFLKNEMFLIWKLLK